MDLPREVAPGVLNTLRIGPRLRLVDVVDREGVSYRDAARPIQIKPLEVTTGEGVTLCLEVLGSMCAVEVFTELDPSSTVARDFYRDNHDELPLPIVTHVLHGRLHPGAHSLLWSGRDGTSCKRILIAGHYRIRVRASLGLLVHEVETFVIVAPPIAFNIGQDYRSHGDDHSTRQVVDNAAAKQRSLKDGSAYDSRVTVAITAREGVLGVRQAALGLHTNHSNPGELAFYHSVKTSEPVHSSLTMGETREGTAGEDFASFRELDARSFSDCLFVMTAGCQTGNEMFLIQHLLNSVIAPHLDPTTKSAGRHPVGYADGIVGPLTQRAIRMFEKIKRLPIIGAVTPSLITSMGLPLLHDDKENARAVQSRLRDLAQPLKTGITDDDASTATLEASMERTRSGIRAYQELAGMAVTGIADKDTITHMQLASYRVRGLTQTPEQQADKYIAATRGADNAGSKDVVESFANRGVEIAIGYRKKVTFDAQRQWQAKFWELWAGGSSLTFANTAATKVLAPSEQSRVELQIVVRPGSTADTVLHPARHGRGA